jgi:hypothetical protein
MNQMLYQPAILIRERTILAERFNRMNGAIRRIEAVQHEMGTKNFVAILQEAFEEWFKTPILKASAL